MTDSENKRRETEAAHPIMDESIIEPELEPHEPGEEDARISPAGQLGAQTAAQLGSDYLGTFDEEDAALRAIAEAMRASAFWPDVWSISDHGNAVCISERFYRDHGAAVE